MVCGLRSHPASTRRTTRSTRAPIEADAAVIDQHERDQHEQRRSAGARRRARCGEPSSRTTRRCLEPFPERLARRTARDDEIQRGRRGTRCPITSTANRRRASGRPASTASGVLDASSSSFVLVRRVDAPLLRRLRLLRRRRPPSSRCRAPWSAVVDLSCCSASMLVHDCPAVCDFATAVDEHRSAEQHEDDQHDRGR